MYFALTLAGLSVLWKPNDPPLQVDLRGGVGLNIARDFGAPQHRRSRVKAPAFGPATESAAMQELLREYLPILVFLGVAVALGLALMLSAVVLAIRRPDPEKDSAYECGFNAFDDARMKFDVRFYLVAILFIIFDLEVAFLFPWAAAFKDIGLFGFWSMIVFLGVLAVGFAYEWKKGALEWE
jgi:NADH-quinone oxidoreductase subunit A